MHRLALSRWIATLGSIVVGLAGACHVSTAPAPQPDAGADAAATVSEAGLIDGRSPLDYYQSVCGFCHGDYRQGVAGPPLLPSRLTQDRAVYAEIIRVDHRESYLPESAHVLSDAELALLLDLIFSPPPPPSAARWGESEIRRSLRVIVADDELVDAPQHDAKLERLMLVTERGAPKLAVIDGERHKLLGRAHTEVRAHALVLHPRDPRWAYSLSEDAVVSKVDLFALQTTRSVRTGIDARALAISDDGAHLAVGNRLPNSLVIIDADTLELERRIETTVVVSDEETAGVGSDEASLASSVGVVVDVAPGMVGPYFIAVLTQAGQVWRVDYGQPDLPVSKLHGLGAPLRDGFLSADNRRFYVESADDYLAVIDVESWQRVDELPSLGQPHPGLGARWPAGQTEYAASLRAGEPQLVVWDMSTGAHVAEVPTDRPGMFASAHPDSRYVWVDAYAPDTPGAITVFDRESPDFSVVAKIGKGLASLRPEPTADAAFVYVADPFHGVVRVYDARYDAQQQTFPLVQTIADLAAPTLILSSGRHGEQLGQ